MTPSEYQQLPSSPVWRRLAALSYDTLLVMALSLGYFGAITWIGTAAFDLEATPDYNPMFDGLLRWFVFLGWLSIIVVFFGLFWTRNGQTLGMQAWKIRVQKTTGHLISYQNVIKRFIPTFLALALYLIGANYQLNFLTYIAYFVVGLNFVVSTLTKGQTLTEIVSNTMMVQVPKDQREGVKSGGVF